MRKTKKFPFRLGSRQARHAKKEVIEVEGEVTEALPNTIFRVRLKTGQVILAHLSGRLRIRFIRILEGDRVLVEMSPYDLERGRIVRRL